MDNRRANQGIPPSKVWLRDVTNDQDGDDHAPNTMEIIIEVISGNDMRRDLCCI